MGRIVKSLPNSAACEQKYKVTRVLLYCYASIEWASLAITRDSRIRNAGSDTAAGGGQGLYEWATSWCWFGTNTEEGWGGITSRKSPKSVPIAL